MVSPVRAAGAKRAPRLDFEVTAEHIEQSIPADSSHCMIADALKTAVPTARNVVVDLATIRFTDTKTGQRCVYLTPIEAQWNLIEFDQGRKPEPFKVKGSAAQVIPAKQRKAKKEKKEPAPASISETPSDTTEVVPGSISAEASEVKEPMPGSISETPTRPYQRAVLVRSPEGGSESSLLKVGGTAPRVGPLARGSGIGAHDLMVGKRRQFGMRAMGRPKEKIGDKTLDRTPSES